MTQAGERNKPLLVFDGDCYFCRRWIDRWQRITGDRVDYAPYQTAAEQFPHIPRERFGQAVHLIQPDGTAVTGAEAVFSTLATVPRRGFWLWAYRRVPGVRPATEGAYRFIAAHRELFSKLTTLLWGPTVPPPSFLLVRWLFLRMLAVIYAIAFASLGVQIIGLVGEGGILPADRYLQAAYDRLGADAYWRVPTLLWLSATDTTLQALCWGGVALAVLAFLRIAPAMVFPLLWVVYLSLYHAGQVFLSFQWDILLLEVGFLAIFFAPWRWWPRLRSEPPPSRLIRFLLVLLLFKLMFMSGMVKLLEDNPQGREWHNLTALTFHYETQCIPNPVAWYAHHLPVWFHKASTLMMFVIEIGVPFLFFLPRRARILAFFLQVLLQLIIIATGNYNFFNLLTIALCITLVDDDAVRRFFPWTLCAAADPDHPRRSLPIIQRVINPPLTVALLLLSAIWFHRMFAGFDGLYPIEQQVLRTTMPFHISNSYGLFRRMTTRRPEIIIEGSNDGRTWKAYEFPYKPGDLDRPPPFITPHQPRLDWQRWFAALGNYRRNPWFVSLMQRLLEGSPDVLRLFAHNPFPDDPPHYIRAVLYDYHFTTPDEAAETGAWWTRKRIGLYFPAVTREAFGR